MVAARVTPVAFLILRTSGASGIPALPLPLVCVEFEWYLSVRV